MRSDLFLSDEEDEATSGTKEATSQPEVHEEAPPSPLSLNTSDAEWLQQGLTEEDINWLASLPASAYVPELPEGVPPPAVPEYVPTPIVSSSPDLLTTPPCAPGASSPAPAIISISEDLLCTPPRPDQALQGTPAKKSLPYAGVTLLSDGTFLTTKHHPKVLSTLPGICYRAHDFLHLGDAPEYLAQHVHPQRRKFVVILAGTRDAYGFPRRESKDDAKKISRSEVSISQTCVKKALNRLKESSQTSKRTTFLCTVPPRAVHSATVERQFFNTSKLYFDSGFETVDISRLMYEHRAAFYDKKTGLPTAEAANYILLVVKKALNGLAK